MSDTDEDISNWLRSWGAHQMHFKAAAEIDRLRAELAEAKAALTKYGDQGAFQALRDANARIAELEGALEHNNSALDGANAIIASSDAFAIELAAKDARIAELRGLLAYATDTDAYRRIRARAEQAEAILLEHKSRAEKAEAELDISREAHRMVQSALLSQAAETERAEAERDAMRELLDWIYGFLAYVDSYHSRMIRYKVRAALAPSPADKDVCNE